MEETGPALASMVPRSYKSYFPDPMYLGYVELSPKFPMAVARGQPPIQQTQRQVFHPDLNFFANFFIASSMAVPARAAVNGLSVIRTCAQAGAPGHKMGPFQSCWWMYKTVGWTGFLRALPLSAAKSFPQAGIVFSIYTGLASKIVPQIPNSKPSLLAMAGIYVSGGIAGSTMQVALHPADVVKTRLSVQGIAAPTVYQSITDCYAKILAYEGTQGLYRGLGASVLSAYVYYGTMFMMWDFLNRMPWKRRGKQAYLIRFQNLIDPVVALAAASFVASPFDVVRRKMMAYNVKLPKNGRVDVVADTMVNTAVNIYRQSGFSGFFRGYLATAFKAAPQLLIFWVGCTIMQKGLLTVSGGGRKKNEK